MCLAIPGKVVEVRDREVVVDYGSQQRVVRIEGMEIASGDYVLVQFGFVVQKVNEEEALESLRMWSQL